MQPACLAEPVSLSAPALASLQLADSLNLAKQNISASDVRAVDGSACRASTADGVLSSECPEAAGKTCCVDIGVPFTDAAAADGTHGHTPLFLLPPPPAPPWPPAVEHATRMQAALQALQQAAGCDRPDQPVYYVHQLPQVGFGSIIEYAALFLGRALHPVDSALHPV